MKFIMAIIKPFKLEQVREALDSLGIKGLTVSDVRGYGRQRGHTEFYRGAEYDISFVPKVQIMVAVEDGLAEQVVETIATTAKTDAIGDGKIFVFELADALRIRTGETGSAAL